MDPAEDAPAGVERAGVGEGNGAADGSGGAADGGGGAAVTALPVACVAVLCVGDAAGRQAPRVSSNASESAAARRVCLKDCLVNMSKLLWQRFYVT